MWPCAKRVLTTGLRLAPLEGRLISFSTVLLDGLNFESGLRLLAKAGARSVEPAFIEGYMPFDETVFIEAKGRALGAVIADFGLSVTAVSAHTDLGQQGSSDRLLRRLDFARGLGAQILISNATTESQRATLDQTLSKCLPSFQAASVVLALENPGHGHGALIADGASGANLLAQFDHESLRLNYDIGNAYTYGPRRLGLLGDLRAALPWTAHLHLKDVQENQGNWIFCAIGAGQVGYDARLASLFPPGIPLGIEVPLRLWRPSRGDPIRKSESVLPSAVQSTAAQCLSALKSFGME